MVKTTILYPSRYKLPLFMTIYTPKGIKYKN